MAGEEKPTCKLCNQCCKHVALEIDAPTTREEFEEILWYLMHKNINVYIAEGDEEDYDDEPEEEWFIEFLTPCESLLPDGKCKIYEDRPQICGDYDPETCVEHGEGEPHKFHFSTREDFLEFLESNYPDWREIEDGLEESDEAEQEEE